MCCSEDPDVKGTETRDVLLLRFVYGSCSEDPDVKGTETFMAYTARVAS